MTASWRYCLKVFFCVFVSSSFLWGTFILSSPVVSKETMITVTPPRVYDHLVSILVEHGISHPLIFSFFLKIFGGPRAFGSYILNKDWTVLTAVHHILFNNPLSLRITIPEGWSVGKILRFLEQNPALSGPIHRIPSEGMMFPDTYIVKAGEQRQILVDRMEQEMKKTVAQVWSSGRPHPSIKSPQELITIASIVEKETSLPQERPRISAVYLNRLAKNMKLQSCPTVIYALTQGLSKFSRALNKRDLKIQSPYNTYLNKGLPPGPIACPGKESLQAVMHPEMTDVLFFVANGKGGHTFSKNFEDHKKHARSWRQNRNSPRDYADYLSSVGGG